MRTIVPILFILYVTLTGCNGKSESSEEQPAPTITMDTFTPPVIAVDSTGKDIVIVDGGDDQSREEMQLYHIVCVEESDDYAAVHATALKVSKFLGFKFDSLERYYNNKKKRIVLPDDAEDEIYAGEYFFRRYSDDFVSIEMRNAYPDPSSKDDGNTFFYSDTTKMFVFAAMFGEKKEANKLADLLKKQFKNTKVIASEIYMGCMH